MSYKKSLHELVNKVPKSLVDMELAPKKKNPPTQASSEFITNREQGDWAEAVLMAAINGLGRDIVAVRYGKGDRLVAGQPGFEDFYRAYQHELATIGKRPDLLLFRTKDYDYDWGYDISEMPLDEAAKVVPKAIAAFEVRSSAFLVEEYEEDLKRRVTVLRARADELLSTLLGSHAKAFKPDVLACLKTLSAADLSEFPPRVQLLKGADGNAARELWDELKDVRRKLTETRDYLSFTPKAEDLASVWHWVQKYDVPHFYVQVFFDRVYGIGLSHILSLLATPDNESKRFFVEKDVKNQEKTTLKINVKDGHEVAGRLAMPSHQSKMLKLPRGRLLFYVAFEGGQAYLNVGNLYSLIGFTPTP